jgi:hypothetical protein
MKSETIDITPLWASILPALVEGYADPETSADTKLDIQKELLRMADVADRLRESHAVIHQFFRAARKLSDEQNPAAQEFAQAIEHAEKYFGLTRDIFSS